MLRSRSLLALTGAAVLAVASVAAAPNTDTTEVTVDGDTVKVAGTLAEGLGTVVIGTDPGDDAVASGYGHDVSEYAVSFPDDGRIAFHLTIADPNPVTGHGPHGSVFEIVPTVDGTSRELTATATADGGLQFGSQTCEVNPDTGVNECSTSPVDGSYEDGVLTWDLPTGASPAGQVNGGRADVNLLIGTATTGGATLVNGPIDTMGINALAQLPTAELLIDGEVAGTGPLSDTGYAVSAAGLTAGDHAASLRLCSGALDFTRTPAECTDVDLGTITIADETGLSNLILTLAAAATSLALVAGTAPSAVTVTDPCGHEPVRENDEGDPEVLSDGSGLPHLDICSLTVGAPTTGGVVDGIELAMTLDGDLVDRRPTDHWVTNFTLDGCGWGTHTFHNATTDTLNPPTTQLTNFCGDDYRSAELTDVELDGEVLRISIDADVVASLGGSLGDGTQLADAMGRTWVGQASTLGPQAVHTWDTTTSANALVTVGMP